MTEITYILLCLITSIEILAIYMIFRKMLEYPRAFIATKFDQWFGLEMSKYIQAPLWDCYICMASVWGFLIEHLWQLPIHNIAEYLLIVCGINTIIAHAFNIGKDD